MFDNRLQSSWSALLPLVMRIINCTQNSRTGVTPLALLFAGRIPANRGLILNDVTGPSDTIIRLDPQYATTYISKLREDYTLLLESHRSFVGSHLPKLKHMDISAYSVGDYVLLIPPSGRAHKLQPKRSGPYCILDIKHDVVIVQSLIDTKKIFSYHAERFIPFVIPLSLSKEDILKYCIDIASKDHDEFVVESIVGHTGNVNNRSQLSFKIHWLDYPTEADSWIPWSEAKQLEALSLGNRRKGTRNRNHFVVRRLAHLGDGPAVTPIALAPEFTGEVAAALTVAQLQFCQPLTNASS